MFIQIMTILLENLSNADVHRLVKPQILSVFGDVALAVGPEFKKYLDVVMQTLMQASQAQVDRVSRERSYYPHRASFCFLLSQSDFDMIDYLNDLRESCLEAYTGIVQGLKGDTTAANPAPELQLVQPHVAYIVTFITAVAADNERSDGSVAACAGLIG